MKLWDYILLNHIASMHALYKAMKRIEREKAEAEKTQEQIAEMSAASPLGFIGILISMGGIGWCFFRKSPLVWLWAFLLIECFYIVAHHANSTSRRAADCVLLTLCALCSWAGVYLVFHAQRTVLGIALFAIGFVLLCVLTAIFSDGNGSHSAKTPDSSAVAGSTITVDDENWAEFVRSNRPDFQPRDTRNAKVELVYEDESGEVTKRTVEPIYVLSSEGKHFLLAFCHLQNDFRLFAIEKIIRLKDAFGSEIRSPTPEYFNDLAKKTEN